MVAKQRKQARLSDGERFKVYKYLRDNGDRIKDRTAAQILVELNSVFDFTVKYSHLNHMREAFELEDILPKRPRGDKSPNYRRINVDKLADALVRIGLILQQEVGVEPERLKPITDFVESLHLDKNGHVEE